MSEEGRREDAAAAMRRINQAWLAGNLEDLAPLLHRDIVMVLPGFNGRIQGREEFLAGFRDFRENAVVQEFGEYDHQVDIAGDTAVVSFRYDMVFTRSGQRSRASGRDLWVLQEQGIGWQAVWRTMLDTDEQAC